MADRARDFAWPLDELPPSIDQGDIGACSGVAAVQCMNFMLMHKEDWPTDEITKSSLAKLVNEMQKKLPEDCHPQEFEPNSTVPIDGGFLGFDPPTAFKYMKKFRAVIVEASDKLVKEFVTVGSEGKKTVYNRMKEEVEKLKGPASRYGKIYLKAARRCMKKGADYATNKILLLEHKLKKSKFYCLLLCVSAERHESCGNNVAVYSRPLVPQKLADGGYNHYSEAPPNSSRLSPSSRIVCRVCQKQFSQYTCPRCNARYCSLHCYKSHSLRCTESFMRENVVGELQQLQTDDETKRKMLEILELFHSEEEADSMDEDDLTLSEETMEKILSGHQRAVASGELSKLIEPWEPLWLKPSARTISLSREGTQLVQSFSKTSTRHGLESDPAQDIPPGPETPLPPINKLSSTEPSPLLAVHLIDIIYTCCFTLRFYNGDWQLDPIRASIVVLSVSSVLGEGGQPESVSEALSHFLEQTCSPCFRHMGGLQFGLGLLDDVIALVSLGGAALVCLLCDIRRLVQAAQGELKSEKPRKSRRGEIIRSKLKLADRKILLYYVEQPGEDWSSMAAVVNAEKGSAMEFAGNRGGNLRKQNRVEARGKALIEELEWVTMSEDSIHFSS
ncbi:hypothetical protein RHMOL_Rhmol10G0023400 [Rhododendron molle]|uniref:Uncharacterized protein n=1 Tax=Rhododendron molle TaxID=49168 RepID=A0ACC0LYF9_RHOML|nr:hypothetical protein RHMOL_Rhmol10G0023400 [Rhododendron molle]